MGALKSSSAPKLRHLWRKDIVIKNDPISQQMLSSISFSSISRFEPMNESKAPPIDFFGSARELLFFNIEIGKKIPALECPVNAFHLDDACANAVLLPRIKKYGYFTFEEGVSIFHAMALEQSRGENGYLVANGFDNVVYARLNWPSYKIAVISMAWDHLQKVWNFTAEYPRENDSFAAGCRVFFSKKPDSKKGGPYAARRKR